jgi:hypothetical protein
MLTSSEIRFIGPLGVVKPLRSREEKGGKIWAYAVPVLLNGMTAELLLSNRTGCELETVARLMGSEPERDASGHVTKSGRPPEIGTGCPVEVEAELRPMGNKPTMFLISIKALDEVAMAEKALQLAKAKKMKSA